ncbi:hypothetical protein K438DRAFT_1759534 [Mycena galopus ATCC 62051]|nr:hypothetical protein K438DRAFT_1759534 [Mycena galopus ATCC 62051]
MWEQLSVRRSAATKIIETGLNVFEYEDKSKQNPETRGETKAARLPENQLASEATLKIVEEDAEDKEVPPGERLREAHSRGGNIDVQAGRNIAAENWVESESKADMVGRGRHQKAQWENLSTCLRKDITTTIWSRKMIGCARGTDEVLRDAEDARGSKRADRCGGRHGGRGGQLSIDGGFDLERRRRGTVFAEVGLRQRGTQAASSDRTKTERRVDDG